MREGFRSNSRDSPFETKPIFSRTRKKKMSDQPRAKRQRQQKQKKWTNDDVSKMLSFLQEHTHFEKPSARVYYKNMHEKTKIDASWTMFKGKVRQLRIKYQEASDYRKLINAGMADDDSQKTIEAKIQAICPHYDQLDEIFGQSIRTKTKLIQTVDVDKCVAPSSESNSSFSEAFSTFSDVEEILDSSSSGDEWVGNFTQNVKRKQRKASLEKLDEPVAERIKWQEACLKIKEQKLKLETEKMEWKIAVEERKLELQCRQLKLEEKKMQNDFELRKLELAQTERLMKHRLELKAGKRNSLIK